MATKFPAIAMALICGALLTWQVGANGVLRRVLKDATLAALTSFGVGTLALMAVVAVTRPEPPSGRALREAPWWAWIGGILGAFYVTSAATFAGRLGSAPWVALVVAGQVLVSLALDHYGLVGFPEHPVNARRLVGAALLIAGVVIVVRN